ncbi:30S ribosomal protein THX [Rufibacter sediminis]|uniref:30S ribosomal protein THX n=1 Tax=Rufibacter sediminis TaxID=2762756 RepID=A0ABR6VTD7_9BACT|nr:30S ribosomal protein THX [Rufibacter sediminis]MBC3540448.1 30S ribosomal protein THX [Rufibacter sediminis]
MGKGDVKSKKGKISKGSYGNSRPQKPKNEATKAAKLTVSSKA